MRLTLALTPAVALALAFTGAACGSDNGDSAESASTGTSPSGAPTTSTSTPQTTTSSTSETSTSSTSGRKTTPAGSMGYGDCIETLPPGEFVTVQTISCDEPHTAEWVGRLSGTGLQR